MLVRAESLVGPNSLSTTKTYETGRGRQFAPEIYRSS